MVVEVTPGMGTVAEVMVTPDIAAVVTVGTEAAGVSGLARLSAPPSAGIIPGHLATIRPVLDYSQRRRFILSKAATGMWRRRPNGIIAPNQKPTIRMCSNARPNGGAYPRNLRLIHERS